MIYYAFNDDDRANIMGRFEDETEDDCYRDGSQDISHDIIYPNDTEEALTPQQAQDEMPDLLPF
jgi:hypothetical protein